MKYQFKCPECNHRIDVEIAMKDYGKEKDKQLCPVCYAKDSNNVLLKRVLEWSGTASGSGEGWFGRSDGGRSI